MAVKMINKDRVALTGFMGVGKSSVARHLARMLACKRIDLDIEIEKAERRPVSEIIEADGLAEFRRIETANLGRILASERGQVLSLGGGTWTIEENRELIKKAGFTSIWLESTFEHCWRNILASRKDRPLARDKASALRLFEERRKVYCLADWHFIIKPGIDSRGIARMIVEEIS